jgi:RNA polymerase sigma-70 factor (ECF subfamily)
VTGKYLADRSRSLTQHMMPENSSNRESVCPSDERTRRFIGLLTKHQQQVKRYILVLMPNLADAEQIAQETSIRLWEQFNDYDPSVAGFDVWARSIAYFQVLTFRKKAGRERVVFNSELVDALADRAAVRSQHLADRQEALIDCLDKLPEHSREIVRLYYFVGMKLRAAAEHLGRSIAATEKAVVRIRHLLRGCVEDVLRKDGAR